MQNLTVIVQRMNTKSLVELRGSTTIFFLRQFYCVELHRAAETVKSDVNSQMSNYEILVTVVSLIPFSCFACDFLQFLYILITYCSSYNSLY
jgi:hypothetical protein